MSDACDIVVRLLDYTKDDHERLCKGREYTCTCGYDEQRDPLMTEAAKTIKSLREANELMLTDIRRTDVDMLAFKARIEQLEAANASLASWQCEFTDGKTGLVYGEGGSTYCAMAKRVQKLEATLKEKL